MTHKVDKTKRNRVNRQERYQRKLVRKKLIKGLTADSRGGYKTYKKQR